jgi:lipoyl(octanoyl) transferase
MNTATERHRETVPDAAPDAADDAPKGARGGVVEWRISDAPVAYPDAVKFMESRVDAIHQGRAPEMVWLLEHPPLYTAGTSADESELLDPGRFPVHRTGRGGRYTYHGPGQRVAYVMLDLRKRDNDVRRFVHDLEDWVIRTLSRFNVIAETRDDRVGIWVRRGAPANPAARDDKIAAIGVRVRRWVTYHGVAVNLEPDLEHFAGIVPCGIAGHGVTSLWDLGITATMPELDSALMAAFADVFGLGVRRV